MIKFHTVLNTRSATFGLLLVAASALSGCITQDIGFDDSPMPYGGSASHPITVAKGPITLEVASTQGTMQPTQINAVIAFTHQAMQAGTSPLTIGRPDGGGASSRVANEVAGLIAQQGIPAQLVRYVTYPAPANAPVRVSYISTHAQTKPCGDWSEDASSTSDNTLMPNHGCAVQANIAAMVANPQSLDVPAATDMADAAPQVVAINKLSTMASSTASSTSATSASTTPATTP